MPDESPRKESVKCLRCDTVVQAEAKPEDMASGPDDGEWFTVACSCSKCYQPILRLIHTYFHRPEFRCRKGFTMVVEMSLE